MYTTQAYKEEEMLLKCRAPQCWSCANTDSIMR